MGAENHGVKPLEFPLLTDENIVPDVVQSGSESAAVMSAAPAMNICSVDATQNYSNTPQVSAGSSSRTTWPSGATQSALAPCSSASWDRRTRCPM